MVVDQPYEGPTIFDKVRVGAHDYSSGQVFKTKKKERKSGGEGEGEGDWKRLKVGWPGFWGGQVVRFDPVYRRKQRQR